MKQEIKLESYAGFMAAQEERPRIVTIPTRIVLKKKWDNEGNCNLFIDEIVQNLDPLVLFILVVSKEEDRRALIRDIGTQIISFINMVDVLDMASLLSVELASAAERSSLLRVMMQENMNDIYKSEPKLKAFLKEAKFRGTTVMA